MVSITFQKLNNNKPPHPVDSRSIHRPTSNTSSIQMSSEKVPQIPSSIVRSGLMPAGREGRTISKTNSFRATNGAVH